MTRKKGNAEEVRAGDESADQMSETAEEPFRRDMFPCTSLPLRSAITKPVN